MSEERPRTREGDGDCEADRIDGHGPAVRRGRCDTRAVTIRDIVQVCHEDEARLVRVETQTRVLADAVLVMTEPAQAIAPAIEAVKAAM
jgi:hypothetical protein